MTEMIGAGQCWNCYYWIQMFHMVGYCYNVNSDHYGHVIMEFHPTCDNFLSKEQKK